MNYYNINTRIDMISSLYYESTQRFIANEFKEEDANYKILLYNNNEIIIIKSK